METELGESPTACGWCGYECARPGAEKCPECGLPLDAATMNAALAARSTFREGRFFLTLGVVGAATRFVFDAAAAVKSSGSLQSSGTLMWSTLWLVVSLIFLWRLVARADRLIGRSHDQHLTLRGMCFLWGAGHFGGVIAIFV